MAKEIERKFLVTQSPPYLERIDESELIVQFYLYIDDNEEIRFRKSIALSTQKTQCSLTIKTGSGLVRDECEHAISEEAFDLIGMNKFMLRKLRMTLKLDSGHIGYLDRYITTGGPLKPTILEVEFEDEESAKAFRPPSWVSEEVTNNKQYKASYLYCQT